jgi:hypothetical protein
MERDNKMTDKLTIESCVELADKYGYDESSLTLAAKKRARKFLVAYSQALADKVRQEARAEQHKPDYDKLRSLGWTPIECPECELSALAPTDAIRQQYEGKIEVLVEALGYADEVFHSPANQKKIDAALSATTSDVQAFQKEREAEIRRRVLEEAAQWAENCGERLANSTFTGLAEQFRKMAKEG